MDFTARFYTRQNVELHNVACCFYKAHCKISCETKHNGLILISRFKLWFYRSGPDHGFPTEQLNIYDALLTQ